ncbi:MAG: hypothetical protein Q9167_006317 [Letrouitia subvulpina]
MSSKAPIDGYVDPKIPNPNKDSDSPIIIYGYTPTLALSALALALYGLLLLLHAFRLYLHRLLAFSILLLTTTIFEIVGYAFRLRSSPPPTGDPYNTISFVIQYFFIVVAPVFLSAGIYTTLTSLIAALSRSNHNITHITPTSNPLTDNASAREKPNNNNNNNNNDLSPLSLPRRLIISLFVTCDILSTIVQVAGAALIGVSESNRKSPTTGNNILLAGLAFQVFSFLLFLILLFIFLWKTRQMTMTMTSRGKGGGAGGGMLRFTTALVGASLLVYLRTIFRLAETAQGINGYASSHEAFFGALEFAPVVLAVGLLGWWHPGRLVGKGGLLITREEGGTG